MARKRHKGERSDEPFVRLVYSVLNSPLFLKLSPYAVKLLVDVAAQYRGDNNGDLSLAWKVMKPRGWRSEATLHKAKRELLEAGFLYETRKGQRPNLCSLFALTTSSTGVRRLDSFAASIASRRLWSRLRRPPRIARLLHRVQ
jgi:hypothetical protein